MTDKPKSATLTTREAAELAGVDPSYIRRLLIQGRMQGHKVELAPGFEVWQVSRASFDNWMSSRKRRG